EEDEGDLALGEELDELGPLRGRGAEEDAVVGDDPDRPAVDVGEAGHERLAVARLEIVEARPVDEPGDDLADLDRTARVGGHGSVQARLGWAATRIHRRLLRLVAIPGRRRRLPVQVRDDRAA